MANYDYIISDEGKGLLASLYGARLEYVEGYRIDFVDDGEKTTLHSIARLHFSHEVVYDLRADYVHVDIADDFCDDVGALSFNKAEGDIWLPEQVAAFKLPVNKEIDGIILVNDRDILMHHEKQANSFAFTKAVLFRSGLDHIAFAIDDFYEDAVVVRRGFDPEELVPDGSGSWYEKPGWTDKYTRTFEEI